MLKIAVFNDTYTPGVNGVIVSVKTFAQLLSRRHRVRLYVPAYKLKNRIEKEGGVVVERYASVPVFFYKDFQIGLVDMFRLSESVRAFNPDVIHIHSPGVMGVVGMLLARKLNKPLVGTYHAILSETLGYLSPMRLIPGLEFNELGRSGRKEGVPQKAVWRLMNRFFGRCDALVVPSEAVRRELLARGMRKKVMVVSNGVDTKMFKEKAKYNATGRKILHVGRLGYEKNVADVIVAFAQLVKKVPEAELMIVGDGPAKEELQRIAQREGVAGNVWFRGWVPRERLVRIYQEADVFVTASAMETQGLVILEAMAAGLPVVAVDKYAVPDLISNGVNGYLVRVGDVGEMAAKMESLLVTAGDTEKMGRKARKTALEHEVTQMAAKMEEIYTDVVAKGKNEN